MRRNGSNAIRYGRVSQETGITYIPQYRRYPLAVHGSALQTYPCTVALRDSLSASPGNWYSTRNEPTGVPGGNFRVAAVALRQPRQRVFGRHLHAVPAEHASEEMS